MISRQIVKSGNIDARADSILPCGGRNPFAGAKQIIIQLAKLNTERLRQIGWTDIESVNPWRRRDFIQVLQGLLGLNLEHNARVGICRRAIGSITLTVVGCSPSTHAPRSRWRIFGRSNNGASLLG